MRKRGRGNGERKRGREREREREEREITITEADPVRGLHKALRPLCDSWQHVEAVPAARWRRLKVD